MLVNLAGPLLWTWGPTPGPRGAASSELRLSVSSEEGGEGFLNCGRACRGVHVERRVVPAGCVCRGRHWSQGQVVGNIGVGATVCEPLLEHGHPRVGGAEESAFYESGAFDARASAGGVAVQDATAVPGTGGTSRNAVGNVADCAGRGKPCLLCVRCACVRVAPGWAPAGRLQVGQLRAAQPDQSLQFYVCAGTRADRSARIHDRTSPTECVWCSSSLLGRGGSLSKKNSSA